MNDIILSPKPVGILYDSVTQSAPGVSLTGQGVKALSIDGMTAGATITVQVRLSNDGVWADYQAVDASKPVAIVEFGANYNRVRVTGLTAGNVLLAQG